MTAMSDENGGDKGGIRHFAPNEA